MSGQAVRTAAGEAVGEEGRPRARDRELKTGLTHPRCSLEPLVFVLIVEAISTVPHQSKAPPPSQLACGPGFRVEDRREKSHLARASPEAPGFTCRPGRGPGSSGVLGRPELC